MLQRVLLPTELALSFSLQARSVELNQFPTLQTYAFQYSILLASLMNSKSKYILSTIEFHRAASRGGENAPPWEDKSMYIFYVDLITGAFAHPFKRTPSKSYQRFSQVVHVSGFLRRHRYILWRPAERGSRRVRDCPVFHHPSAGPYAIPHCNSKYG